MEWGDEQIQELLITLQSIAAAVSAQQEVILVLMGCIEQLDARSQVTTSAFQSLTARLEKLEAR